MYVFVKARVEGRFDAPDQLVVRISSMLLLSEVMEKYTKSVSITVPLDELTAEQISRLHDLAKKHRGKASLRIRVEDANDKMFVDLPSRKFKVNPREILASMTGFPGAEVRLLHD
jgi:DNA polymerase-3 subunit alpha